MVEYKTISVCVMKTDPQQLMVNYIRPFLKYGYGR